VVVTELRERIIEGVGRFPGYSAEYRKVEVLFEHQVLVACGVLDLVEAMASIHPEWRKKPLSNFRTPIGFRG
jgi:hypothetical protein